MVGTHADRKDRAGLGGCVAGGGESSEVRSCLIGTDGGEGDRGTAPPLLNEPCQAIGEVGVGRFRQAGENGIEQADVTQPGGDVEERGRSPRPERGDSGPVVEEPDFVLRVLLRTLYVPGKSSRSYPPSVSSPW